MITVEIKGQIDRIWDAFWSGGIANPIEVNEQITYLQSKASDSVPVTEVDALFDSLQHRALRGELFA